MCYICSCFAWGLDLIQRVVTFGLMCLLACAVCIGLFIAVVAGIAYGYNYSMAEFITFTRSDVTVYMRRGQFSDNPDLQNRYRRTGAEEELFSANETTDYEDQKPQAESKPLADTWLKTQDTRKYAEILTKYAPKKTVEKKVETAPMPVAVPQKPSELHNQVSPPPLNYRTTPESPIISIMPNPLIPTIAWRSGSSEIIMRNFKPMHDYTTVNRFTDIPDGLFPTPDRELKSISLHKAKDKSKETSDDKLRDDYHKSFVPMRVWGTTTRTVRLDDANDDLDEDNIVYKPV